MTAIATGLARAGLRCVRFEFPYMAKRRDDGRKRGPDRMPKLLESWADTLNALGATDAPLFIGGKSMAGAPPRPSLRSPTYRSRSRALSVSVTRSIRQANPRTPASSRSATRARLSSSSRASATRSANPKRSPPTRWKPPVEVTWIPDGDHSLVPRKRSGHTEEGNLSLAVCAITDLSQRVG